MTSNHDEHARTMATHEDSCEHTGHGRDRGRDPVEELAAEFAERFRQGERVSVEGYARRHPELAGQIRELFPTVVAMERLHAKRQLENGVGDRVPPKQLGDYRVLGEIARGGMGIVYEAEQVSLGRRVAVKVLPQHALRRERDVRRFEREAQTAANLHHSNIVPVFGVGEDHGCHYLVMQRIRGVGLDEILREIKRSIANGSVHDETVVTTSRLGTVRRSAAGLLESELRLQSTIVDANADTLITTQEDLDCSATSIAQQLAPQQLQSAFGAEYYRNVARIGLQVAQALDYAHRHNTLHRDVKPGNLLLDQDGRVWIADFGLAKAIQDESVTCSGDIVGTMAYVAPERFQGVTTKASDIYSLGITLHEMLTLQKVFDGKDRVAVMNQVTNQGLPGPRKLNPAVPRDLETIVLKAAARDVNDRYASAAQLATDLEAFLTDRPIRAHRLSGFEHALRWCRRNRVMASLAATVMLLLVAIMGLTVIGYVRMDMQRERAESTAQLALSALDEIYARFAASPLNVALADDDVTQEELADEDYRQMPISRDVAVLLENLLGFYDELSRQTGKSDLVATRHIVANRRVGDIQQRLGQLDDARQSYCDAIDRIDALSDGMRDTEAMRLEAARARNGLGMCLQFSWRSRESVGAHREAVAILDHDTPTEEEEFELASSLYLLHIAERKNLHGKERNAGAPEASAGQLERATSILTSLKSRRPTKPEYDLLLARCLLAECRRPNPEGGLDTNQTQAISILESLVERAPNNPAYQFELGDTIRDIERADQRRSNGTPRSNDRLAKSEARLRRALEVTADLESRHPNIPRYYILKKDLHVAMAELKWEQKQYAEADREFAAAVQMQRLLMESSESPWRHEPWLYRLELSYATLLMEAGDVANARERLIRTVEGLEDLVARNDVRASKGPRLRESHDRRLLASVYGSLSDAAVALGDLPESQEWLRKANALER